MHTYLRIHQYRKINPCKVAIRPYNTEAVKLTSAEMPRGSKNITAPNSRAPKPPIEAGTTEAMKMPAHTARKGNTETDSPTDLKHAQKAVRAKVILPLVKGGQR